MERGSHVGPYLIEQPLGEGSVSAAYRAVHQSTGEIVALKLLRCRVTPKSLDDFFLQAKSVQDLEHPGIIKILDAGMAEDKVPYWVEELAPGDNLEVYMGRHRRGLPLDVQLTIAQQIAGIFHATHEISVPHLSLNPANVFLSPEPSVPGGLRIQLTGYGAHFLQILGPGSSYAAAFQAPEQFGGALKVSDKTDFYSLGCLLFFAATGTPPFPGGIEEILAAHMKKAAPRISDFNPAAPHGLNLLVAKLLEKPPDERPKQARSIITAIEAVRKEMPIAAENGEPRSAFRETIQRISSSNVSEEAATHVRLPAVSGEVETAVTTVDVGREESVSVVVPEEPAAQRGLVAPGELIGAPTVQVSDVDEFTDAAEDFSSDAFESTDFASDTFGTGYGEESHDDEYDDDDYGTGAADDFSYRTSDASQEYTAGSYSYSESSGQQFGLGSLGPGEEDGATRAGKRVTLFGPGHVEGNQPITSESAAQRPFGTGSEQNGSNKTRSPAVTVSGVTGPSVRASAVADGSNPGKSREKMDAAYALPLGDLAKKDIVPDHLRDAAPAPWMDKGEENQEVVVGASAGSSAPSSNEGGEDGKVETNLRMEGGYPNGGPYGPSPMGYPNQGGQPMPNYGPDQYRYPPPRQGGRFWPALIAVFFALLLGGALALFLVFGTNLFKGTQPGTLARDGSTAPAIGNTQAPAQQQPVAPNAGVVPGAVTPVNGAQPGQNGLPPSTVAGTAPQNGAFDARIENEPSLKDQIAQSGTANVAPSSGANLAAGTTDPNGAGVPRVIVFHTIDTVPEGATVFVAGRQAGVTPFRQELSAQNGVSAISVQKPGYLPVELELPTNRSAHRSISLRLVGGSVPSAAATSPFTDPVNLPTADEAAAKAKAKAEAKEKAKKRRAKRRRSKRRNRSRVREGFIDEDDVDTDDGGGFDDEPFEEGFIDE